MSISSLKDKVQLWTLKRLLKGTHDLRVATNINEPDNDSILPTWFKLLEKFNLFKEFTAERREIRDYTLPLPNALLLLWYDKPFSMADKSKMLTVVSRARNVTDRVLLLRMRREFYINQYRKKQLYDLAISNSPNIYAEMYALGFGFEFNMLASSLKYGTISDTVRDLKSKLSETVRLDNMFRHTMRDLRITFVVCYVMMCLLYLAIVYTTYIMTGVEFTSVMPIFVPGLSIINSLLAGNYFPIIHFVILNLVCLTFFNVFQVWDMILLRIPTIRNIILFFETLKFLTAMDLMRDTEELTEYSLLKRTISTLELPSLTKFLQFKLDEVKELPDLINQFILSNHFFDESDASALCDVTSSFVLNEFYVRVGELLTQKRADATEREVTDKENISVFKELMLQGVMLAATFLFLLGDLQLLSAAI